MECPIPQVINGPAKSILQEGVNLFWAAQILKPRFEESLCSQLFAKKRVKIAKIKFCVKDVAAFIDGKA